MVALILAVGAILSCGHALRVGHKADPSRPEHVIMISVDGMAPYYYTAAEALRAHVPNLNMLKSGGAYAGGRSRASIPTLTYPLHTTPRDRCAARGPWHPFKTAIFEPPTEPQTRAWYCTPTPRDPKLL